MKFSSRNLFLILLVLTLPIIVGCMPQAYGQLATGDILVLDFAAGTGGKAALFRVDPTTGVRTVLSDFGSGANQGVDPGEGMAIEASGQILVTDPNAGTGGNGALFRVDPTTGVRTLLSDFGIGINQGVGPHGVAVEISGQILVVDYDAGTGGKGALFRVDPTTGARTLLSDFGSGANQGVDPCAVAVEASGQILVIDPSAGTGEKGALFRVDPTAGARTLLSNFGSGANRGEDPVGVAVEASGQILVADSSAGSIQGALFRVDPVSGVRTILSDFDLGPNQGVEGPVGVAVEASGQILATDYDAGTNGQGALFRVDPTTGVRTVLSDFGSGANQGVDPWAMVVVPAPVNASGIFQGNLVLQGNNVTIIEGRFDINGSIMVEENATLILRNALVNFTQSKNYQHVLVLQNPSNGFPRLQVDNATITTSDYWFQMNFYGNSTVEAFKLQMDGKVQPWAHDNATVTVGNGSLSQFYALASSQTSFTDSSLVQYSTWENSSLQLINCTWAQTPEIYNQSSVMISFYLDVHVVDSLMQNVPEALVTATYMGSMHNWTAATASSGWARLTLWQMMKNASGDYLFPSYNVEAAYLTHHHTTNVNMTGNQQTTIEMEFVIPEFPSQTIIFIFITTALLAVIVHRRKRLPT